MTFAELKQQIQDYCENQETTFVNNLSNFIESAEERIFKNVQLMFFRRNQTGNLTASNPYLNCPSDFLAPFSLSFKDGTTRTFLLYKDVNFLQEAFPDTSTTGNPKYYAFFDIDNFIVAPTPDDSYAVDLHYFYRPASLTTVGDGGTTWLSENAPQTLLYGSLIEAYTFMKGEQDVIQNYDEQFKSALMRLKNFGEALEETDAYRTGLIIRPKT
jgi:Neuraminidase (sialidase)